MHDPFNERPAQIARHRRERALVEAFVRVEIAGGSCVIVQVIVPSGGGCDDWARRAETAARVTVEAVRNRLLAQLEGDRE